MRHEGHKWTGVEGSAASHVTTRNGGGWHRGRGQGQGQGWIDSYRVLAAKKHERSNRDSCPFSAKMGEEERHKISILFK